MRQLRRAKATGLGSAPRPGGLQDRVNAGVVITRPRAQAEPLAARLARMPKLEDVVWCQEEPKNNGSWFFAEPLVEESLAAAKSKVGRARYAGRAGSASPATGLAKRHAAEQAALVADALGLSVRSEIRRRSKSA